MAKRTGVAAALGTSRAGRLALWQVLARAIDQGSRLSAVRLAAVHAGCDVLDSDRFDEDDLYANLDWLAEHQPEIERRLVPDLVPRRSFITRQIVAASTACRGANASLRI